MNNDDYSKKQKSLDAKYEREYRAWVESLSANERRDLEAMGLHAPCVQRHGNGSAHGDAADSPMMAVGSDPAEIPEPEIEEHDADHGDPDAVNSAVRRVVAEIIYHDNARLTAECIALISGLSYDGCSMTEIAKRHGFDPAIFDDVPEKLEPAIFAGIAEVKGSRISVKPRHRLFLRTVAAAFDAHFVAAPNRHAKAV